MPFACTLRPTQGLLGPDRWRRSADEPNRPPWLGVVLARVCRPPHSLVPTEAKDRQHRAGPPSGPKSRLRMPFVSSMSARKAAPAARRRRGQRVAHLLVAAIGGPPVALGVQQTEVRADLQPQVSMIAEQRVRARGAVDGEVELAVGRHEALAVLGGLAPSARSARPAASMSPALTLRAAHSAARPSTPSRTRAISKRSRVKGGMPTERPAITVSALLAVSRCSASRTGMALTPNALARLGIVTVRPGSISPSRIISLS